MPNWCSNKVVITDFDPDVIEELRQKVTGAEDGMRYSAFSLNQIKPVPEEYSDPDVDRDWLLEEYGCVNSNEWCTYNWGTKWDVDAALTFSSSHALEYEFASAWDTPLVALIELSNQFPSSEIVVEFDEPGNDFWGMHSIKNGEDVILVEGSSRLAEEFQVYLIWQDRDGEDLPDENF